MDDQAKSKILEAWNRLGEAFLSEVTTVLQQKVGPPVQIQLANISEKREPSANKKRDLKKHAARKRLTKKVRRKVSESEEESSSSQSSEEDTYQPPPLAKKEDSPSQESLSEDKAQPLESAPASQVEAASAPMEQDDEASVGLSSSSSSASPSESPRVESIAEADPYEGLTFSAETLLRLNTDISDAKDDPQRVKRILDVLDSLITSFQGDFVPVLRETNILRDLRKVLPTFLSESRAHCDAFLTKMKERVNGKSSQEPQDDSEEWRKLEKQLAEKINRKSDTEILAVMRRIDEIIPDHTNSESQRDVMRPCFRRVQQVSVESKHTEVQRKAAALYKRWRGLQEHSDSVDEPEKRIALDREKVTKKLPGIYEEAKNLTEAEKSEQKTTRTISATHVVGVNKKRS